jgi:hypothetical protein
VASRIVAYHKEGMKLPPEAIESVAERGAALGLAAARQVALLALARPQRLPQARDNLAGTTTH